MNAGNQCKVCRKNTDQKCGKCQQIFYCCKEHQMTDWKRHRKSCHPFKLLSDGTVGRFLSVIRDLNRNEVILKETPLIVGPSQVTVPVCLGCHQEISRENYKTCSKCGWPMCSSKCEKNLAHLPECYLTKQSGQKISIENFGDINPLYQWVTVLRCLYQKQHNSLVWSKLIGLESHCEQRQAMSSYRNEQAMATEVLQTFFKLDSFTMEEIMKIIGVIMVNSHEVPLSEPPYLAIFEKSSMLEHNCRSNCTKSFTEAGEILIVSGVPIKKGEHLSICYADPLWNTARRRAFLYETKYFWCSCPRCLDPSEFGTYFSAVRCQNGDCSGCLLPAGFLDINDSSKWACNKCTSSVSNLLVSVLLNKIETELLQLDDRNVEAHRSFIKKLGRILPPKSCYLSEAKLQLIQLVGSLDQKGLSDMELDLRRMFCTELAELTEIMIPSEKRVRGTVLFQLHACLAELARRMSSMGLDRKRAHSTLQKSKIHLEECIELLKFEPLVLPEGKIYQQAQKNLLDMKRFFSQ
ncbi:SET domain-containing protein SmydA-8 [Dendroctonus ponderosae]|uniref:SET domain-containing protein SmydA-8 n=1 Tax=Dendroctonus ponderosae TaxID=77166 RepID=UPI0020354D5D|nr:SET domain-containing protein SmydA-8 [Dendroctonus ponderosae]KAH1026295.1 hypothetical protein HUJ05_010838 [Dendroctonus ponderosae]